MHLTSSQPSSLPLRFKQTQDIIFSHYNFHTRRGISHQVFTLSLSHAHSRTCIQQQVKTHLTQKTKKKKKKKRKKEKRGWRQHTRPLNIPNNTPRRIIHKLHSNLRYTAAGAYHSKTLALMHVNAPGSGKTGSPLGKKRVGRKKRWWDCNEPVRPNTRVTFTSFTGTLPESICDS